ncbi:MAG: hypothetical protein M3Y89_03025, partial [Actinomycetota bacterium]|nr:hypothetical protein [Actinomycetota bacterium]
MLGPMHRRAQVAHSDQAGPLAGDREPPVRVGTGGRVEAEMDVRVDQARDDPVLRAAEHRQVGWQQGVRRPERDHPAGPVDHQ